MSKFIKVHMVGESPEKLTLVNVDKIWKIFDARELDDEVPACIVHDNENNSLGVRETVEEIYKQLEGIR